MIQLKVLKQWIQKPLFIPCILFVCVIAGIVGTLFLTMPVIKTVTATTDPASRIIILDASHGGEDGGTSSTDGTKEKDINLAVTLRLKAMLESAGFQVKMTRETDIAVNDPNLDTVKQRKVSDIKNRLKLIQNTPYKLSWHYSRLTKAHIAIEYILIFIPQAYKNKEIITVIIPATPNAILLIAP